MVAPNCESVSAELQTTQATGKSISVPTVTVTVAVAVTMLSLSNRAEVGLSESYHSQTELGST